jgi:hypothetical protein
MEAGFCGKLWSLDYVVTEIDVLAPLAKAPGRQKIRFK